MIYTLSLLKDEKVLTITRKTKGKTKEDIEWLLLRLTDAGNNAITKMFTHPVIYSCVMDYENRLHETNAHIHFLCINEKWYQFDWWGYKEVKKQKEQELFRTIKDAA